jgi:hypothetical protein
MIFRAFRIILTVAVIWVLWISYDQLGILRGTFFWEFRYIFWLVTGFLMLSVVEWGLGWLYRKFHSE